MDQSRQIIFTGKFGSNSTLNDSQKLKYAGLFSIAAISLVSYIRGQPNPFLALLPALDPLREVQRYVSKALEYGRFASNALSVQLINNSEIE